MESLELSLSSWIASRFERGRIFFVEDLEPSGIAPEVLRVLLSRMVRKNLVVIRLARGVYCYPRVASESMQMIVPGPEEVAAALAARYRVRIAPCGAQAAYLSGLTSVCLYPYTYVSDGSPQTFRLQGGKTVEFIRRRSVKIFDFRNEKLRNLVEGLRHIGMENLNEDDFKVVDRTVREVPLEDFLHDVRLAPQWIRRELLASRG